MQFNQYIRQIKHDRKDVGYYVTSESEDEEVQMENGEYKQWNAIVKDIKYQIS